MVVHDCEKAVAIAAENNLRSLNKEADSKCINNKDKVWIKAANRSKIKSKIMTHDPFGPTNYLG